MTDTTHLICRKGVWYYHRRVPRAFVKAAGIAIVQVSLGTRSLKEARLRRAVEDIKWQARFGVSDQSNTPTACPASPFTKRKATESELLRLVQDYVERTDEQARRDALGAPPESEAQRNEIKTDIDMGLCTLVNRDDPRGDEMISHTIDQIVSGPGSPTGDDTIPYAAFAEIVRRGLMELDRRRLARVDDNHGEVHFDQLFEPRRSADISFEALADQYVQIAEEEASANNLSRKWLDKQRANAVLLKEIIGTGTSVRSVDFDVCLKLRTTLARLPSHRTKLYSSLPVSEAIVRADTEERPRLASITQEQYIATFRDILALGLRKRLIQTNPADGLKPLKRDALAPEAKRRPFKPEQLKAFFEGGYYRRCAHASPPYSYDESSWRFWLPLMCVFMGLRPNEACQMHVDDLRQTQNGTWFLDVVETVDEAEGTADASVKTLKTATSRRRIPVHPELSRIGFVAFVSAQRSAGCTRLFPGLKPDGYDRECPPKKPYDFPSIVEATVGRSRSKGYRNSIAFPPGCQK